MINLFKKKEEKVLHEWKKPEIVIDSKYIKNDIQESFQQILNQYEIDISNESKIEELQSRLEEYKTANQKVYEKIETLQSLGLVNTPSVRTQLQLLKSNEQTYKLRMEEIAEKIKTAEYTKDLVRKHSEKYPMFKFVTKEVMISIMKKYDLCLADAFLYGREIPQENLEIIKGFQKDIKETESTTDFVELTQYSSWGTNQKYYFEDSVKVDDIEREAKVNGLVSNIHYKFNTLNTFKISNFKMVAPESHFEIPKLKMRKYSSRIESEVFEVPAVILNPDTRIFEFNEKQVEEVNKTNREVLDPIACLEVEGGFVIMSSWDKEAEIPEIQNENWN